jgi:hypothetical protein
MGVAFEKYVEKRWRDALNVAAAEPQGWESSGGKTDKRHMEKPTWGGSSGEKPTGAARKAGRAIGAANIVMSRPAPEGWKCKFATKQGA